MPEASRPSRSTWLPFALCLLLTAAAAALIAYAEGQAERARLENDVNAASHRIRERIVSYMAVLRATAGFLSQPESQATGEFRAFVARLKLHEHYPGTQGIGYAARLKATGAAEATALARAHGWTNARVWPEGPRDEVGAVVLIEPRDERNLASLGFDMRTEPVRREAMERACEQGDVALSGPVTLVQEIDADKQAGVILYAPVYAEDEVPPSVEERRGRVKGYAFAALRVGDLFQGVFGDEPPAVAFDLFDGTTPGDEHRLYTFGRAIEPREHFVVEEFPIGGRTWMARFVPEDDAPAALLLALVVTALGVFLSVVVLLVTRARERARSREVSATAAALATQEILRYNDMFIGVLGHDLRTPLHAIALSTELLLRASASCKTTLEALTRIRTSAHRMARMIEQILDLTRARLGGGIAVAPEPVELGTLVRDVVDETARACPEARVELTVRGDLAGRWDADRLAQVFSNLLDNAVRHRREAPVRVTLEGAAPERVVARVENAGVIAPALLPGLFEPFRGSDRPQGGAVGLGLGLYITRAIVEAHGGSVAVTSSEATGTIFTVILPRDPHGGVRPGAPAPPGR